MQVIILNPKPRNINMYANELVRRYEGNVYDRNVSVLTIKQLYLEFQNFKV